MKDKSTATLPPNMAAWHFLSRTCFGPRTQEVERTRQEGVAQILEEQLHPERIDDSEVEKRIASLPTLTMSPAELMEDFPAPQPVNNQQARQQSAAPPPNPDSTARPAPPGINAGMEAEGPRRILMELGREQLWRAAYSRRQLQEVMVQFWMNHHFIADEPSASVVDRTARTFTESQGNIPSVLRTILTSREFNSPAAFRAKVKSPFELVASSLRTLDAETDAGAPLMGSIVRMGQPLFQYQAPTGYPDRAGNWINSGTLLARWNFSMALAGNRIRGTQLDLEGLTPADDQQAVWNALVQRTLGGSVSPETQAAVMRSLDDEGATGGGNLRAFPKTTLMAALLLGSPDFQRR